MDFRKFDNLRVDLETIFAYKVHPGTSISDNNRILLFSRDQRNGESYFVIRYSNNEKDQFEEDVKILDQYFGVKTKEESKLLP